MLVHHQAQSHSPHFHPTDRGMTQFGPLFKKKNDQFCMDLNLEIDKKNSSHEAI